ncbi:uncharacterized protein LOC125951271 isoform X2 [Anopheles darlingi]|uniref:uncharacterized protein LOC125951271 isoform X2 n=1 Tax=Anopheles darlingi TaxID=43151 RepID=UPI00210022D8|nr:uncharacterized protein LOC125951271 isoform X2 [Anopheles darlingi]
MDTRALHLIVGFIVALRVTVAGDDLGLLSSTLRAFRTFCCDDELLTLSCPIGTSISVELVQYGGSKEANDTIQCPYSSEQDYGRYYAAASTAASPAVPLVTLDFTTPTVASSGTNVSTTSVLATANTTATTTTSTSTTIIAGGADLIPTMNDTQTLATTTATSTVDKCTPLYVLQYSILQTVVEACQKKRRCRIQAAPKNFATAPCPGIHRLVEVNHKCRPFEFRSLTSCEKDIVRLSCGQYTRIAIYSAAYGRTAYESTHCTQSAAAQEQTCLSEHTSHTLTEICQGRRKCTVAVESSTFGNPCPESTRVYLKVIYACVSRNVFRERYITAPEDDELDERPYESNELYDEELTPAPNQIEGSAIGKGPPGGPHHHHKYSASGDSSSVKAENIVTFNKDAVGGVGSGESGGSSQQRSAGLLADGQLLIVGVAVLFFCCVCLSFGALLAYKMKLFPARGNRCVKASDSTDSHSTPSSYRPTSEDFDLVDCGPDSLVRTSEKLPEPPMATQTFVQAAVVTTTTASTTSASTMTTAATGPTPITTSSLLPAFKFAEMVPTRGAHLSQISTTMFILPNYLMTDTPIAGTLSHRRPPRSLPRGPLDDSLATCVRALPPPAPTIGGSCGESENRLTITLASSDLGSGNQHQLPQPSQAGYYAAQHPQHPQHPQHHHHPSPSCTQCAVLGWSPIPPKGTAGTGTVLYGGPVATGGTHPTLMSTPGHSAQQQYHRNQSLKSSSSDGDGHPATIITGAGDVPGKPVDGGRALPESHSFLWLGLRIGLM